MSHPLDGSRVQTLFGQGVIGSVTGNKAQVDLDLWVKMLSDPSYPNIRQVEITLQGSDRDIFLSAVPITGETPNRFP